LWRVDRSHGEAATAVADHDVVRKQTPARSA